METLQHQMDSALRERGIRVTQARRSVFDLLASSSEPMSASQISESLQSVSLRIDLVTVYRTLETLERCGLIARFDRMGDGWRYTIRARSHRHSITCSRCGGTAPLEQCDLHRIEKSLESTTGFADVHHSLQFFGTCPGCQG